MITGELGNQWDSPVQTEWRSVVPDTHSIVTNLWPSFEDAVAVNLFLCIYANAVQRDCQQGNDVINNF
jgi:hypothetical protein